MSGDNFRKRVWKPLIEETGVPYINIHGLRHTFATITAKLTDAATLRDLLGHESAAFTMDEYVHPDDDDKRQAVWTRHRRRLPGRTSAGDCIARTARWRNTTRKRASGWRWEDRKS